MSHRPEIRSTVTGNSHYQEPFKPLIGGIRFADFNDLESVKAQVTKKTCAIILETVASLNAVYPLTNRLIEISRDGQISEDESPDFSNIQENLEKVSLAIEALQLWVEKEVQKADS